MHRIRIVSITIVVISCIMLTITATASAAQAQTVDVTFHGIHDNKGGCRYKMTAPAGTHGKSIHSDLASCTMIMEHQPGPAPDAPKGGVAGPKHAFNTAAGGTDPTSQGHLQVWTWDCCNGQADDSIFAYLSWSWNGWSVLSGYNWGKWWANNDGSGLSWNNNWYLYGNFNNYYYRWSSNEVMSYSTAQFYTTIWSWYGTMNIFDTYNYAAIHGYGNGDAYCNWSIDESAQGNGIGYECVLDGVY